VLRPNRELPVVWSVAKGSFLNKLILVPLALVISAFAPWLITPLLMLGGAYLCYEGVEKVLHILNHDKAESTPEARQQRLDKLAQQDPRQFEKDKVKGAVRTDFILSAEIVAITLGIVSEAPLLNQVLILAGIAILVTIGVYGIVAMIVKIDDLGYWLREKSSTLAQSTGAALLALAPWLMKVLSVVGTVAMFLVGGGIIVHGIAPLHHAITEYSGGFHGVVSALLSNGANLVLGFIIGSIVLLAVNLIAKLRGKSV
jgi:Uncharacterized protein conserved in bacteria